MRDITTRVVDEAHGQSLQLEEAELRVIRGPDKGLRWQLGPSTVIIGTGPISDLVLTDDTVSSAHAEIVTTSRGYLLRDLDSKNGTRLDRIAVERAFLRDGARIALGETVITVSARDRVCTVPLARPGRDGELIAHSVSMRALVATARRIADSDATVLITGETGTGKEHVAAYLHQNSSRSKGPFVVLDCGAVPASLFSATLFGHVAGAFTGAVGDAIGLFERADQGTLFVDEIGELDPQLQPILLRVFESGAVTPVGGGTVRRCDVRIIAATNRNLKQMVKRGSFREDLYYRVAVACLRVPSLRERVEDIPFLAEDLSCAIGVTLDPSLFSALQTYSWPGNVRELRNTIERLQLVDRDLEWALPNQDQASVFYTEDGLRPLRQARALASARFEQDYMEKALEQSGGVVSEAARIAGVSRQSMSELVRRCRRGRTGTGQSGDSS